MNTLKATIGVLHHEHVFKRRLQALCQAIAPLLEAGNVLDLGAGNGMIAQKLMGMRSNLVIIGVDVLVRPDTYIPVIAYDGMWLPFADKAFSSVVLVDVLHHTPDFRVVLRECSRVSRTVIIKDHFYSNSIEHAILRGLDWVGNAPHGVDLPYNYFTRHQWQTALRYLNLQETYRTENVPDLYPQPFHTVIGQRIQFISKLTVSEAE